MEFIKKHIFTILAAVVIACMVLFGSRFVGNSGKVLDVVLFAFLGAALLVIPAMEMCSKILEKLKELAPGIGVGSGEVHAGVPIDRYPQRTHRDDLELALVHSLSAVMHGLDAMSGAETGAFIRAVADSILGVGQQSAKPQCTCAQYVGAACSNCPVRHDSAAGRAQQRPSLTEKQLAFKSSVEHFIGQHQSVGAAAGRVTIGDMEPHRVSVGAQADQRAEAEIVAAGLTAPRVTAEQIQALMNQLTWEYEHKEGSRHTFAHAFLGDFYIASGHNAPVSRENFDAGLGRKYAREQAEGRAREKLWGMEGYVLAKALKVLPS